MSAGPVPPPEESESVLPLSIECGRDAGDRSRLPRSTSGRTSLVPELLRKPSHFSVRKCPVLGSQELGVHGCMSHRSGPVAYSSQSLHVAQRDSGIAGILEREAAPPFDRLQRIAPVGSPARLTARGPDRTAWPIPNAAPRPTAQTRPRQRSESR